MLELPRRVSTIKYKSGVLLVNNKEHPPHTFTREDMEKIGAMPSLAGFYTEDYPMTDDLLEPLAGLKNMVNLGVINGKLTDRSFAVFATMPKLQMLWLEGNAEMTGGALELLKTSRVDTISMKNTAFGNAELLLAARLPKLSRIHVDGSKVSFEGIMAVAENSRLQICAKTLFSQEQLAAFEAAQRDAGKTKPAPDSRDVAQARAALQGFFAAMTAWETEAYKKGITSEGLRQPLQKIFDTHVSEKPRMGYRPLGLSASAGGTYSGHEFVDAEQVTKNKLYLYTKDTAGTKSAYRFLMRQVDGTWKVDYAQVHWDGWQRWGL